MDIKTNMKYGYIDGKLCIFYKESISGEWKTY